MKIFEMTQAVKRHNTSKEKWELLKMLYRLSGLIQSDDLDEEIWRLEQELEEEDEALRCY